MDAQPQSAASVLIEALAALGAAKSAVEAALAALSAGQTYIPATRYTAAVRTTATQVLAILAENGQPMTLIDIADAVVALRRDEDEPKKRGGTRYQEMCRNAIVRLIERGLVRRVEPREKREKMRFERV
jgi:c-di-GMP-binding flagellar brake protein YcgR